MTTKTDNSGAKGTSNGKGTRGRKGRTTLDRDEATVVNAAPGTLGFPMPDGWPNNREQPAQEAQPEAPATAAAPATGESKPTPPNVPAGTSGAANNNPSAMTGEELAARAIKEREALAAQEVAAETAITTAAANVADRVKKHEEGARSWMYTIGLAIKHYFCLFYALHGTKQRSSGLDRLCKRIEQESGDDYRDYVPRCLQIVWAHEVFGDALLTLPISSQKAIGSLFDRVDDENGKGERYILADKMRDDAKRLFALATIASACPDHLKETVRYARDGYAMGGDVYSLSSKLRKHHKEPEKEANPFVPAPKARATTTTPPKQEGAATTTTEEEKTDKTETSSTPTTGQQPETSSTPTTGQQPETSSTPTTGQQPENPAPTPPLNPRTADEGIADESDSEGEEQNASGLRPEGQTQRIVLDVKPALAAGGIVAALIGHAEMRAIATAMGKNPELTTANFVSPLLAGMAEADRVDELRAIVSIVGKELQIRILMERNPGMDRQSATKAWELKNK